MRVEAGVPCIKDARERLCHVRRMRDRDGRRRDGMLVGAGGGAAVGGTRIRHNTRLRLVRRTAAVVVGCSTGRWWARGVGQRRAVRAAATTHVVASSIVPRRRWPAARCDVGGRGGWGSGGRYAQPPRHTGTNRDANGQPPLTGLVGCRGSGMHEHSERTPCVAESVTYDMFYHSIG